MSWMRALTFTAVMNFAFAPPAFALKPVTCAERIMAAGAPPGVTEVYSQLRKLGLSALLTEVDRGEVSISVRRQWLPWHQAVGTRVGWMGRKQIVLRGDLDISTRERQEKFTWDIAIALFQLQMQPWFWSRSAVLPHAELPGVEALTLDPADYFAWSMPRAWRDQYLARAKTMLAELYIVFLSFRDLQATDLMPAQAQAREIGPNVQDLETLKRQGVRQLQENVTGRHARSVLFNYYMAHLKRAMIITSTFSTLLLLPQIATYGDAEKQVSASEQRLEGAPARALETEIRTREQRRQRFSN